MLACNFKYKNNLYPEAYLKPMKSYHETIVRAIDSSGVEFKKYDKANKKSAYRMPVTERKEADRVIGTIRKTYGNVLEVKKVEEKMNGKKNIITEILEINITPVAERLYHAYEASKRVGKEEESSQFNIGGDIMPTQDKRIYKGTNIENQAAADIKAQLMEERFNELGISSKILYDTSLEASGALLGKGTQEYQDLVDDGIIGPGEAAIIVNPNKLYADTIFHEYGHLLVDLLSGTNDARINQVYNDLINTPLANQVREAYPELKGEAYKRELVTQALGKKAEQLFADNNKQTSWKKFVLWVKNTLNKLFNTTQSNELVSLANQLLGNSDSTLTGQLNELTQLQKEEVEEEFVPKKIMKRRLNTLQGIRNEIYRNISKQIVKLRKNPNEKVKEYVSTLEGIQKNLDNLDSTEDEFAILEYVNDVSTQIDKISAVLNSLDSTSKKKMDMVGVYNKKLDAYSLVMDIKESLDSPGQLTADNFSSVEAMENLKKVINETYSKLNNAKSLLNGQAVLQLSEFMADYFNYAFVEARDKYFIEFNSSPENIDRKQDQDYINERQEFIDNKIANETDNLRKRNVDLIRNKLKESSADLTYFASRLQDEKDVNDIIIQLVSKIIDDADLQRDTNILNLKIEASELYEKFRKDASGTDPKKIFEGYYEEGSDGNLYLTGEYSVEYHIARSKHFEAISKAEKKYGEDSEQVKKAVQALKDFYARETNNKVPKAKWKNPNYSKVKDSEMHKWLMQKSIDNNQKLEGHKSNIVTNDNYTVIKMPNIGKSGFEKLSSGSLLANMWESIQRTYKVRADNTEFGGGVSESAQRTQALYKEIKRRRDAGESLEELQDEINMLQVLTDEVGDLKTQIPIFFRGQHNLKDISYDLISSMLMDSYMAENYHQKSNFKYAVQLSMDLVNSRKVTQTEGIMKRVLVEAFGGDDKLYETVRQIAGNQSNSAKLLASVIENRLYGIKTVNAEYAQIANSLMAWSATAMLGFNFLAASSNVIQGKVVNFIESVGGEHYDAKDLLAAEGMFWADYQGWVDDLGRPVQTSKTSQLLDILNVQGEFKAFTNKLTEDNRFKTLFKTSTLFAYNHLGEFYIHSTMMYAVLNRIKAKNAKGQYIDSQGRVVTKDKAMNIADAITVNKKTNKLELNKHVRKTSFGQQEFSLDPTKGKGLLEIKNLVNNIANDLHGQYNDEYQSYAQRHVLLKMVFMLRKWIIRGFTRRWRGVEKAGRDKELLREDDKFYSEDSQNFKEGYYTSFIRFLSRIVKEMKGLGLRGAYTKTKANMTEHEIANVRKTMADLGVFALTLLSSMMIYSSLDGLDDDDEKAMVYLAFYSKRLYNELSFFSNPASTFQILASPAATVSYVEDITRLFGQVISDSYGVISGEGIEYYERGRNKGYPKMWKRFTGLVPIASQFDRDVVTSANYQFNTQ